MQKNFPKLFQNTSLKNRDCDIVQNKNRMKADENNKPPHGWSINLNSDINGYIST